MELKVRIDEQTDDVVWVYVEGDVNIHTSPDLRAKLKPLFAKSGGIIHVDLSGVSFMDSSGIATLVEGLQWARGVNGTFTLHHLQETVKDIFILAKLDAVFDIAGMDA